MTARFCGLALLALLAAGGARGAAPVWEEYFPDGLGLGVASLPAGDDLLDADDETGDLLGNGAKSAFGPADKAMSRFPRVCEKAFGDCTLENLARVDAVLAEAAAAAKSDALVARRIALLCRAWSVMRLPMDALACRRAILTSDEPQEILRLVRRSLSDGEAFEEAELTPQEVQEAFRWPKGGTYSRWKTRIVDAFATQTPLEPALDEAFGRLAKKLGGAKAKAFLEPLAKDPLFAPYAVPQLYLLDHQPVAVVGMSASPGGRPNRWKAEPRTRYRLSCRVKAGSAGARAKASVGVRFRDGHGQWIDVAGPPTARQIPEASADRWTDVSFGFTTPVCTNDFLIVPVFEPDGDQSPGARLRVDGLRLEKLCVMPQIQPVVTVTITFDDQTKDHLKAAELLEKYGWRGCFNVITRSVAANKNKMTWDDIRELKRRGHEIASHTYSHPTLTELLKEVGPEKVLKNELIRSRDDIARETGSPPRFLCHPYISSNAEVDALIREAGMIPYGHDRCILGTETRAGTSKGVGAILDRCLAEGKRKIDLLVHGVEPSFCGWNPFLSFEEFEAALKEIKERENAGSVRVVSYDEFIQ